MPQDQRKGIELREFQKQKKSKEDEVQSLNGKVAFNVMKLLGQQSKAQTKFQLPKISMFYISPGGAFTFVYNLVYILLFYMMQIQLPLIITFGQNFIQTEFINQGFSVFYWFIFGFFIFDILISLHKGYYQYGKGKICNDSKKIIVNYLKTQIYFDIPAIACLVLPRIQNNQNVNLLLFIPIIFLWVKKSKYVKQIISILQYRRIVRIIFTLGTLFIDVLLQGHYGACIFTKIDLILWNQQYYGSNPAYYWLSNNDNYAVNLMSGTWYDQYVYAQSFSTGTLSTLAPGPFVKNPIQVCFALFVMIYFMLFASYIGQILISTLNNEQAKRVFHQQNIQDFDKYMILKNISQSLKTRIYNFFELIWEVESRLQTQDHRQVINLLPMTLRDELLVQMSFVKSFFMLQYVDQPKRLQKLLAYKINRTVIDSGTCLFKQAILIKRKVQESGLVLSNIYFLSRGMVKYYITMQKQQTQFRGRQQTFLNIQPQNQSQNSQKKKKLQEQNQKNELVFSLSNSDKFLGLYEFITKRSLQYCCKAIDLCEVDTISRKDFYDVIKITKNEEIYQKIKHQLLAQNQIEVINKVCSICFKSHIEQKCPQINIRQKFVAQIFQEEGNCGRSHMRKRNLIIRMKKNKEGKLIKSKKVHMKQKPKLESFLQKKEAWSIFDRVLGKTNLRLEDVLFSLTRIDEIEQSHIWKRFYPEDNVDRVNYIMSGNQRKQSLNQRL